MARRLQAPTESAIHVCKLDSMSSLLPSRFLAEISMVADSCMLTARGIRQNKTMCDQDAPEAVYLGGRNAKQVPKQVAAQ